MDIESGQVGNLWAKANDMFAHNDALQFSDKLTKLAGTHGLKFGISVERGQKQRRHVIARRGPGGIGFDHSRGRLRLPAHGATHRTGGHVESLVSPGGYRMAIFASLSSR